VNAARARVIAAAPIRCRRSWILQQRDDPLGHAAMVVRTHEESRLVIDDDFRHPADGGCNGARDAATGRARPL
jgi:hypothetical protein